VGFPESVFNIPEWLFIKLLSQAEQSSLRAFNSLTGQ
jgi:hypothetical protein